MKRVEWPSVRASRSAVSASAAAGSRCSAGSSRTRMEKSASSARATATRWRCPPERRGTGRADAGGQSGGQPGEPVAQADPGQHGLQLVVAGRAPAHPQVLGQGRGEEMWALFDQADHRPHLVGGQAVQRHAVERRRAGVDGQEAHQDVGQRRLAGPAPPDERHPAPRGEIEVHPAQDRSVRPGVAGPHRAQEERVRSPHRTGEPQRGVRLDDGCRGVRGGEHPAGRRARALQRLGRSRQAGRRARRRRAGRGPARPAARRRGGRRGWRAPRGPGRPSWPVRPVRWSGRARCRSSPRPDGPSPAGGDPPG